MMIWLVAKPAIMDSVPSMAKLIVLSPRYNQWQALAFCFFNLLAKRQSNTLENTVHCMKDPPYELVGPNMS